MRVFDVYSFNIATKAKFKDTKKYIDTMLKELGYEYKNIAFTYNGYLTKVEQVLEKYPNLSKYHFAYEPFGEKILTSLTPDWAKGEVYAAEEDHAALFEIVSKCPRGMNITGKLIFDKIDWYGEGVREPALGASKEDIGKALYAATEDMINSQIIMQREYDELVGKNNRVDVVVEATTADVPRTVAAASKETIMAAPRDTTDILQKLIPYLGEPEMTWRVCRNSLEEEWELKERAEKCAKILCEKIEKFYPRKSETQKTSFLPRLAEKKKIREAFYGTSFQMNDEMSGYPGMNAVVCTDAGNRKYDIVFDRTQSSPDYFYWYVYIKGYNFWLSSGQNTMYASSVKDAEEKLRMIAKFCEALIGEMEPLLSENFGETPAWYSY